MILADVGNAEIGLIASGALAVLYALAAWVGKRETTKLEKLGDDFSIYKLDTARKLADVEKDQTKRATDLERQLTSFEAHQCDERLRVLEGVTTEIRGDLRSLRETTGRIDKWVERQSSPQEHPHRRSDDPRS